MLTRISVANGLIIVDEETGTPVVTIREVSDDKTINLFLDFPQGVTFVRQSNDLTIKVGGETCELLLSKIKA